VTQSQQLKQRGTSPSSSIQIPAAWTFFGSASSTKKRPTASSTSAASCLLAAARRTRRALCARRSSTRSGPHRSNSGKRHSRRRLRRRGPSRNWKRRGRGRANGHAAARRPATPVGRLPRPHSPRVKAILLSVSQRRFSKPRNCGKKDKQRNQPSGPTSFRQISAHTASSFSDTCTSELSESWLSASFNQKRRRAVRHRTLSPRRSTSRGCRRRRRCLSEVPHRRDSCRRVGWGREEQGSQGRRRGRTRWRGP